MGSCVFGLGAGHRPSSAQAADLDARPERMRAYWESLRPAKGGFPSRQDLDPRAMAQILENVFLGERVAKGIMRLRIAGSGLARLCGSEMQNAPLSAVFHHDARADLAEALEAVFQGRAAISFDLRAEGGLAVRPLVARLRLLPLRCGPHEAPLLLGCLVGAEATSIGARRFRILSATREDFTPPRTPRLLVLEPRPLGAAPAPRRPAARPELRLVHSAP